MSLTPRSRIACIEIQSVKLYPCRETRHECFVALLGNFDIRSVENPFSLGDCSTTSLFSVLRKEIQEFHQHIFGCDQFGFRDQFAGRDGALMPLVARIERATK